MRLDRSIKKKLISSLKPNKVILLLGPRRVGKTILLKQITETIDEPYLILNGEDFSTHDLLEKRTVQNYKQLIGNKRLLFIDEAQKIPGIGTKLKLMVDEIENIKIIITGSSAFDILGETGEPLTGRKITFTLFPFSEQELMHTDTIIERRENLHLRLIYGNYPEVTLIKNLEEKSEYLKEIINSYLLKDILMFENIKNSSRIINLLRLISFQVGSQVSIQELASQLQINRATVEKYLDLLSKVFVLYKLEGFSRNLRKEIVKHSKWYFYDNGIRNAVIANFSPLNLRSDTGMLWENYIMSERIKHQTYSGMITNNYFWRTYDQQEIDLVEERGGNLYGYEFKWKADKIKAPAAWKKSYPDAGFDVISQENYFDWVVNG
ncbi:MAG: putative ATPase [Ignavibacteria bacterium]|nr:MAG: putative ATPase [Ignavibacteria bacterium]KAF0160622.1 MAG: putative ATPase [Ignavibacteria bacterium]